MLTIVCRIRGLRKGKMLSGKHPKNTNMESFCALFLYMDLIIQTKNSLLFITIPTVQKFSKSRNIGWWFQQIQRGKNYINPSSVKANILQFKLICYALVIYNIKMLSQDSIDHNAENRRSEKTLIPLPNIIIKIGQQDYHDLTNWLFEVCDQLQLRPTTRCLCRNYLDQVIVSWRDVKVQEYLGLAVHCLGVAIQFNELRKDSQRLTAKYLLKKYEIQMSSQQYFSVQTRLLQMRLKITTPYQYFSIFFSRFQWHLQAKQAIADVLHLTVTLPEACSYLAQEIFYASVLAIFEFKHFNLTELQVNVLNALTDCWPRVKTLTPKILQVVRTFFEPEQQN